MENVRDFIENHRSVAKWHLVGVFSQIISKCMNSMSKTASQAKEMKFDFKDFQIFNKFKITSKNSVGSPAVKLSHDEVKKLIDLHNKNGHSLDCCSAIVQLCLAMRYDEVCRIGSDEVKLSGKDCSCKESELCSIVVNSCFYKINITKSKTGALEKYLIPNMFNCFKFIEGYNEKLNYAKYSKFLKDNINCKITPHSLRSFLPNLCITDRYKNTWANSKTFKKHYLLEHTQLFDLYQIFSEFLIKTL